jgi:hypothetical protein
VVSTDPLMVELEDQVLIARAADEGFRLVRFQTRSGTQSWEWRRGSEPRPQFTNRRVALHWMGELLAHDHGAAYAG